MKKRINITMSESMIACADLLAERRGMNRSEYINYLVNLAVDREDTLLNVLADESAADMHKIFEK